MAFKVVATVAAVVVWIGYKVLTATHESRSEQIIVAEASASAEVVTSTRAAQLEAIHRNNSHLYDYSPLEPHSQDIRVLEFEYSYLEQNELKCTLKRVPLSSYYLALSYAWGDECDTVPITVNGLRFEITRNLLAALQRINLLGSNQKTVLWVDAICINQGDPIEKGPQLRRMPEIYAGAHSTLVWLGEGTDRSDRAMTYFGKCCAGVEMDDVLKDHGDNEFRWHGLKVDLLLKEYEDNKLAWHGLGDVALRGYFRRLWIVQEIIVSSTVIAICGKRCLPFYMLTNMMSLAIDHELEVIPRGISTIMPLRPGIAHLQLFRKRHREERALPLRYWITSYAFNPKCSDDRDRVWAFLGLASDRHAPGLAGLRYEDSVNDTYEAATRHIIDSGVDLDFICLGHGPNRNKQTGFPSWVPDLRLEHGLSGLMLSRNYYVVPPGAGYAAAGYATAGYAAAGYAAAGYAAAGFAAAGYVAAGYAAAGRGFSPHSPRLPPNRAYLKGTTHVEGLRFSNNGKVLAIPGVWVDCVKDVGDTFWFDLLEIDETQRSHYRTTLSESFKMAQTCTAGRLELKPYVRGKASYLEAYARTLTCDRNVSGQRCRDGEGFFPYNSYIGSFIREEEFVMDRSPKLEDKEIGLHIHWRRRRFMISDGGLMGMVPENAEPGDHICVFFGCTVPIVLRKIEGYAPSMERFTFIGECYVHGIMDGEVIDDMVSRKKRTRSFRLA